MADLRDGEVAVSEKNDSATGPSGRRARSASSFYLLVGGSRDVYDVTVNFDSKNGHWCQKESGDRCHGNGNGKGRKYGPPQGRDKRNPQEWCKHVQAALANTEALAEAQERTARAFGRGNPLPLVQTAEGHRVRPVAAPGSLAADARQRLADLEGEAFTLRQEIEADKAGELRKALAALVADHGFEAVNDAARAA